MPTPVRDKYYLKTLHEEIALFDRKLAHLQRYETFASEKDRNAAAAKMSVKRGTLVRTAQQLREEGVEFLPSELPRSIRTEEPTDTVATEQIVLQAAQAEEASTSVPSAKAEKVTGPRALPFRDDVREYLLNRKRGAQLATS